MLLKAYLNDYPYFFNKPLTIFQSVLMSTGVSIARFCFHVKLTISGNCRMCLIEEKKSAKPVLSCSTLIANGMQIYTYSKTVKKAREGVIEYLLINHPLDCPICDQGGECDLQDQTLVFGSDKGRFYETHKRAVENKNYSPMIKFLLNRCIHCSRCVRFLNEISETYSLSLLGRGLITEISGYLYEYNNDYTELSGNIVDLCPVGALTSKPYAFLSRPWEIIDIKFIDFFDTTLSKIKINFRGFDIVRVLPSVSLNVNGEWISDKIRFSYDSFVKQRLINPIFIIKNKFFYLSWKNLFVSYKYFFVNNLKFYYYKKKNNFFDVFVGKFVDFNLLANLKNTCFLIFDKFNWFFDNKFSSSQIDLSSDVRNFILSKYDFENFNNIFFINCNLRYENPIFNLYVKESNFLKNKSFFYFGYLNNFNSDFIFLGNNFKSFLRNNFIFSKPILILMSSNNSSFLNNYLFNLSNFFKKINSKFVLFNLNFVSTLLINELNIINKKTFLNIFNHINFNYSHDDFYCYFNNKSKFSFSLYQGHHGDYFAYLSNFVIPTSFLFEKQTYFFINIWGCLTNVKSFFYKYSINSLKDDSKILIALKEFLLLNNNKFFLNVFLSEFPKNVENINFFCFNKSNIFSNNKKILNFQNNSYFVFLNNYFISDSISRISTVMSLCSLKFLIYNDYIFIKNIICNLRNYKQITQLTDIIY